jgi:flagellar biosynthesis protein FliQ
VTDTAILHIALQTMIIAAKLLAPILLTALSVGLGVALLQSVTQLQEVTLSFVPKMVGVALAVLLSGNWMLGQIVAFTHELFQQLPSLLGRG